MDPQASFYLRQLAGQMQGLEQRLSQLKSTQREAGVAEVGGLPGHKMTFFANLVIGLTATTDTKRGVYTVSQTGSYMIGALAAFWREDTEARWRPISSHVDNVADGASVNAVNFNWSIKTAGQDHQWQSDPMPSAVLVGSSFDRPFYLPGPPVVVSPNGSLVVEITPIKAPDAAGDLHFVFLGAYNIDTSRYVR